MTARARITEQVVQFDCEGDTLIGILAAPAPAPAPAASTASFDSAGDDRAPATGVTPAPTVGVVIVVGGPQYRIGAHRQFVFLARALAAAGIASLRFDARGMGDSGGGVRLFTELSQDVAAAVLTLRAEVPTVRHVALWGLCDGASAALIAVADGLEVASLILVNPWVQDDTHPSGPRGRALWRYYQARLRSPGFWRGLRKRLRRCGWARASSAEPTAAESVHSGDLAEEVEEGAPMPVPNEDFVARMRAGLAVFEGETYLVLSGRDLTADAFRARLARDRGLRRALARTLRDTLRLPVADHTFSSADAREVLEAACIAWLTQRRD